MVRQARWSCLFVNTPKFYFVDIEINVATCVSNSKDHLHPPTMKVIFGAMNIGEPGKVIPSRSLTQINKLIDALTNTIYLMYRRRPNPGPRYRASSSDG